MGKATERERRLRKAVELYEDEPGISLPEIAAGYRLAPETIRNATTFRRRPRQRYTGSQRESAIAAVLDDGRIIAVVARERRIDPRTLDYWVRAELRRRANCGASSTDAKP